MKEHEKELLLAAINFVVKDNKCDISETISALDFEDMEAIQDIEVAIYKAFGFEVTERIISDAEAREIAKQCKR